MKFTIISIMGAASAFVATPALAQDAGAFSGVRVGATVGSGGEDFGDFDGQTVGVEVGFDSEQNGVVGGVGLEYQTDLGDEFLDVNETALIFRIGTLVGPSALLYVNGGPTMVNTGSTPFNGDREYGIRGGAGVEFAFGGRGTSLKVEQRYYSYGQGVDAFQTVAGVGFRF